MQDKITDLYDKIARPVQVLKKKNYPMTAQEFIEKHPRAFYWATILWLSMGIASHINGIKNFYYDKIASKPTIQNKLTEKQIEEQTRKLHPEAFLKAREEPMNAEKSQKQLRLRQLKKHFQTSLEAIFEIESGNNPNAERYESHLKESSYGLGQILTSTAKHYERKYKFLPRLGSTAQEIKQSLLNPEINKQYTFMIFKKMYDKYKTAELAVAAYNSGPLTPANARTQQRLNDLLNQDLRTDGIIGKNTRKIIKQFQEQYKLIPTGKLNRITRQKIKNVWQEQNQMSPDYQAEIPAQSQYHVEKFKKEYNKLANNQ